MTSAKIPVAYAKGDGIGPEIMEATLHVLSEAGAPIDLHEVTIGEKVYLAGGQTGMESSTWEILRNTKAFLKAPITTPQGGGYKSLNVTVRGTLGLYANVRPCASYSPFVETKHPKMNVVIVRENEEDLYAGIEYQQTPEVCTATKLISRPGSEKIVRYAFEYARAQGRKKVTCFVKDNIMKLSDGLFHQIFDEIAAEYQEIEADHWIIDIGAAKLADTPDAFDVIVTPNLYGDIISDIAAQISGSVGLVGSANIGDKGAMFEAIHGSAPRRAGQNVANPSALLHGAILMLAHLNQPEIATRIHNAWLKTIEMGIHTYDIFKEEISKERVGTKEFANAIAKNLGKAPEILRAPLYKENTKVTALAAKDRPLPTRSLVGADIYLYSKLPPEKLHEALSQAKTPLILNLITNRGAKVWPEGQPETFCIDQFRCRFVHKKKGEHIAPTDALDTQKALIEKGFDIIKTENLYAINDSFAFSSAESMT